MGHVKYRHCIAMYLKLSFLGVIDKLITGGSISESGTLIYILSFSRDNERQADETAIKYLEKLRLSTKGMAQFFKKSGEKKSSSWVPEFFATHPLSDDRRKLFESNQKIYEKSYFSQKDLAELKNAIKKSSHKVQL